MEAEKIKQRWEGAYKSGHYTEMPWEKNRAEEDLVRLVEGKKVKKGSVLDICCGAGTHSIYLAKKGFDVTGIDISDTAIKTAKERAKASKAKADFLVGNAFNLKFREKEFDFIFDRGCFHHVPPKYRRRYISGIYRVLKNRGRYLLMCFSSRNLWNIENIFSLRRIRYYFETPFRVYSLEGIKRQFSGSFKILEAKEIAHREPSGEKVILWSVFMQKLNANAQQKV